VSFAAVPLPTTTTTTTTVPPTTTTLPPATTTTVEGQEPPPSTEAPPSTEPAGPLIDPSGFPDEPPAGAIAPALHTLLTSRGVAANVATCAVQTAYDRAGGETELLALGLTDGNPDALAIVVQASVDCGVPSDVIEDAIAATFG
jgi:hypothetical protein